MLIQVTAPTNTRKQSVTIEHTSKIKEGYVTLEQSVTVSSDGAARVLYSIYYYSGFNRVIGTTYQDYHLIGSSLKKVGEQVESVDQSMVNRLQSTVPKAFESVVALNKQGGEWFKTAHLSIGELAGVNDTSRSV